MSEPVAKDRPFVDLDDFERRLGQNDRHHEDPLAELARLVGEHHDPYGEVFAQEAVAHQPQVYQASGRRDPAFGATDAVGMSPRLSGDFAAIEAGLRGALSAHPEADPQGTPGQHEFYAQHEHYAEHEQAYVQDHEDQQWTEAPQERAIQPPPRSRRPIYAMVATIAIGVIGVGVAFAYKGSSSSPSEIRTIAAASGPTKIQPPADASSDQANQDAGVLGKNGQPAPTQLVSREEQPVDISQAVQQNTSRNPDAGPTQGDASNVPVPASPPSTTGSAPATDQAPTFGMSDMPPPKKVKVVSVRPDGTILSSDAPAAADSPVASMSTPRLAAIDGADPVAKPATPRSATPKAGKPKTTSRVTAKPAQVAKSDDDDDTPTPKPARKAKPQRVASAEPTTDDATTAATDRSNGGGFAVQLAAPGSESEARSASSRLAKKFATALDGRHLAFHKAQSNGKSVFRVRVSSLTKEDAVSLCDKLKADGGTCFIAKNN